MVSHNCCGIISPRPLKRCSWIDGDAGSLLTALSHSSCKCKQKVGFVIVLVLSSQTKCYDLHARAPPSSGLVPPINDDFRRRSETDTPKACRRETLDTQLYSSISSKYSYLHATHLPAHPLIFVLRRTRTTSRMRTHPNPIYDVDAHSYVGAYLVFLLCLLEHNDVGYPWGIRSYLGEDVLLRLALLDLEQRWARDVHVPLFDERSLRGDIKATNGNGTPQKQNQRNLSRTRRRTFKQAHAAEQQRVSVLGIRTQNGARTRGRNANMKPPALAAVPRGRA